MATYEQIKAFVKENSGYTPKPCWIAHVKEINGLNPRVAPYRYALDIRTNPCPTSKQEDIRKAFKHFGMI